MDCGDLSRWVINKMEFVIAMGINYTAVAPGVSSPRLDMIVILNGGNESISFVSSYSDKNRTEN